MKNLIIIPAYNEQESIEKTVEDIKANAPRFDYIVVNDCSKDNTGKICREKKYNVINLPVNLGIGGAVQTGYRYAWKNGYETAVQVDGDGQHDPKFLEMMLTYLERKCRYGDRIPLYYQRRISVIRAPTHGNPVFYLADSSVDRKNRLQIRLPVCAW